LIGPGRRSFTFHYGDIRRIWDSKRDRFLHLICNQLKYDFDAVIVSACKRDAFESYLSIQKKISPKIPVIFLDGGDSSEVGGDLERESSFHLFLEAENVRPFDLIFKREVLELKAYDPRIRPFPMCINTSIYSPVLEQARGLKKTFDVAFWAVESSEVRSLALERIQDQFDCRENGSIRGQTFRGYARKGLSYLNSLASTRITLNFRGVGWDTLRYWECPALGTFLLSQKPRILIEHPFINEESIVYVSDDLSDLLDKCNYYLKNEKRRETIARNARSHAMRFHRTFHRAATVISAIHQHRYSVKISNF